MVRGVLFKVCLFVCLSASVTLPETFDLYKAVVTLVMHIQWVMTFKMTSWFAHLVNLYTGTQNNPARGPDVL